MISNTSQRGLDVFLWAIAIFFPTVRILLLADSLRKYRGLAATQIAGAACLTLGAAFAITIGALDWVDMRNFEEKGGLMYRWGDTKIPYRMTKESSDNHWQQAILQICATFCFKGSYLSVFWTIADNLPRSLRLALHAATAYVCGAFILALVPPIAWCHAPGTKYDPTSSCINLAVTPLTIAFVAHVSCDVLLFVLVLCILKATHIRQRPERLALAVVFTIAGVSVFTAGARYYVFMRIDAEVSRLQGSDHGSVDFTAGMAAAAALWSKLELVFGIATYGIIFARAGVRYCRAYLDFWGGRNQPRTVVASGEESGGRRSDVKGTVAEYADDVALREYATRELEWPQAGGGTRASEGTLCAEPV